MKSFQTLFRELIKKSVLLTYDAIWYLFDFSKFKKINKKEIKKVLIFNLGSIGELMTTTTLLPVLKKELNCHIEYMVAIGKEKVLLNNPHISKIFATQEDYKKDLKIIQEKRFDLAILMYPATFKNCYMCYKANIKYRIGSFPSVRGGPDFFLTRKTYPLRKQNAVHRTLDIIRQIGINNPDPKLELHLTNKEKSNLNLFLKKHKIKNNNYAIVHPSFSSSTLDQFSSRLWPIKNYAKTVDHLIEKHKVKVFLTGGKKKVEISQKIKDLVKLKNQKNVIIANELLEIRGLTSLVSTSKLLVSCGTGVVHIAASFNIPTVVFEGKGDHIEWEPWNPKKNYKMLFHPEVCTGCDKEQCRKKTVECMKAITVPEVKEAIDELMERNYKK